MKKAALVAAMLTATTPAFAGNVEVFVAPDDPVVDTPVGSNAGWIVPVLAVVIVGAAIALSDD